MAKHYKTLDEAFPLADPAPGPWEALPNGFGMEIYRADECASPLAVVLDDPKPGRAKANAYLMATAPVLLELVERLAHHEAGLYCESVAEVAGSSDCVCWRCEWIRDARFAISRAKTGAFGYPEPKETKR
jgi:hypothetical protein